MTKVSLLTDEPLLAAGVTGFLNRSGMFEVVSVFTDPDAIARQLRERGAELALLSVNTVALLPRTLPQFRPAGDRKLVLWCRSISHEGAREAVAAGFRGLILKTAAPEHLLECLLSVAAGEVWIDDAISQSLLQRPPLLTRRQRQMASLVAQGLKNKEIASVAGLSEGTVKVYLSRIYQKLGVGDRMGLALYGLNLLPLPARSGASEELSAGGRSLRHTRTTQQPALASGSITNIPAVLGLDMSQYCVDN